MLNKKEQRLRRSRQTRIRIAKQDVARLTVFRSNLHIYASVISHRRRQASSPARRRPKEVRDQLKNGGNVAAATASASASPKRRRLPASRRWRSTVRVSPTTAASRRWRKRLAKPASSSDRQRRNLKWQSSNLAFRTKVVTTVCAKR
jgi:hypothetical protein